jgi:hypothetical protein
MAVQDLSDVAFPKLSKEQMAKLERYDGSMSVQFVHEYLKTM